MYDKESVYDEEIAPLMKQIIEICKREEIPMAAQFYLKKERDDAEYENHPMWCTTVLNYFEHMEAEHKADLSAVAEAMKYGRQGKPVIMTGMIRGN